MRFFLLLFACWILPVQGQDYPARELRSICNFAPGSGADIIVRFYSEKLSRLAGKPVVVENRPGRTAPSPPPSWRRRSPTAIPS